VGDSETIDLIRGAEIEHQRMGQGGRTLGPFRMPEGGRVLSMVRVAAPFSPTSPGYLQTRPASAVGESAPIVTLTSFEKALSSSRRKRDGKVIGLTVLSVLAQSRSV